MKYLLVILLLTACSTPKYVLKNEKTGQVEVCGGNVSSSMAAGMIGYEIQKDNDRRCAEEYRRQGFKDVASP